MCNLINDICDSDFNLGTSLVYVGPNWEQCKWNQLCGLFEGISKTYYV